MKKHIGYFKIKQYRNVIKDIIHSTHYDGQTEDGEVKYDYTKKLPTLIFNGTVKLHGTNASVCYNDEDGVYAQSRTRVLSINSDNHGFAFFVKSKLFSFEQLFDEIIDEYEINTKTHTISIFGEWAGIGIQSGVGIAQLPKSFYIFGLKITKISDELNSESYWLDSSNLRNRENNIFNVEDYKTYKIEIDFDNPKLVQNKFVEIVKEVELECPIAKAFGINTGTGEGVVFKTRYKDQIYMFKVKGKKHSVTKVKTLVSVDVEKLNSINEFVEYAVTENRFKQSLQIIFENESIDIKKLGEVIRWNVRDIISEELDTMNENNLVSKDVNKSISKKVKEMFFKEWDNI